MKLFEYEGKEIFEKYSIPLLSRQVLGSLTDKVTLPLPVIVKAQVRATERKLAGF
jgi:succinyl-CoA synthetase beta subunit